MAKSLNDIATAYDRDVDDVTTRLIGMLEPALTLMIGGILAWVVLAVRSYLRVTKSNYGRELRLPTT